jgi:hypothetical protein
LLAFGVVDASGRGVASRTQLGSARFSEARVKLSEIRIYNGVFGLSFLVANKEEGLMKIKLIVTITLLAFFHAHSMAQGRLEIDKIQICSYDGQRIIDDLYSFESDREAKTFVEGIMKHTGFPQNFTINAANVPNASAALRDGARLVSFFVRRG